MEEYSLWKPSGMDQKVSITMYIDEETVHWSWQIQSRKKIIEWVLGTEDDKFQKL